MDFSDDLNYSDLCYINFFIKSSYKKSLSKKKISIFLNINLINITHLFYYNFILEYKKFEFDFILKRIKNMYFLLDDDFYIIY